MVKYNLYSKTLILAGLGLILPVSALADPIADPINTTTTVLVPAPQPSVLPPAGDSSLKPPLIKSTQIAAVGGVSEASGGQGGGGGVAARMTFRDDSFAEVAGTMGQPFLRIRGQTEMLPLKFYKKEIIGENGEVSFELVFIPIAADGQITITQQGGLDKSHLFFNPTLAAEINASYGPVWGKLRLRGAPTVGGVVDGDGSRALTYGGRIGVDSTLAVQFTDRTRAELQFSWDQLITPSLLPGGPMFSGKALIAHELLTGQTIYGGAAGVYTNLDVKPVVGPDAADGRSWFVGPVAGVAF